MFLMVTSLVAGMVPSLAARLFVYMFVCLWDVFCYFCKVDESTFEICCPVWQREPGFLHNVAKYNIVILVFIDFERAYSKINCSHILLTSDFSSVETSLRDCTL